MGNKEQNPDARLAIGWLIDGDIYGQAFDLSDACEVCADGEIQALC